MPFSFPASPSIGDKSTQNGREYEWSGYAWEIVATPAPKPTLTLSGGTTTPLLLELSQDVT